MQNDQGWPLYVPPQPPAIDEITIVQAQEAHNLIMDADGLALLRLIDNRVDARLDALLKEWQHTHVKPGGDA